MEARTAGSATDEEGGEGEAAGGVLGGPGRRTGAAGGSILIATVDRAAGAARTAAAAWVAPDAGNAHAIEHLTDTVTATVVQVLAEAGCLVEPAPAKPSMGLVEAARLLCALSLSPRLQPPDEEDHQLLTSSAMVDYAWNQAIAVGIPPAQLSAAHEARRVLRTHHRGSDGSQS